MPERLSASDPAVQQALGRRTGKYGAVKVLLDGFRFDSVKESRRYADLRVLEQLGQIHALQVHPKLELHVNGVYVGRYTGDFSYVDAFNGEVVLEDVKSPATRKLAAYRLRKRMVEAEHGLVIREV